MIRPIDCEQILDWTPTKLNLSPVISLIFSFLLFHKNRIIRVDKHQFLGVVFVIFTLTAFEAQRRRQLCLRDCSLYKISI